MGRSAFYKHTETEEILQYCFIMTDQDKRLYKMGMISASEYYSLLNVKRLRFKFTVSKLIVV